MTPKYYQVEIEGTSGKGAGQKMSWVLEARSRDVAIDKADELWVKAGYGPGEHTVRTFEFSEKSCKEIAWARGMAI